MNQSAIGNQKSAMLVECVPNFSEGRKPDVIDRIASAITSVTRATVLDRHIDPDHNRSIITFVSPPAVIVDAALKAVATAAELIDLRSHRAGPRSGAADLERACDSRLLLRTRCSAARTRAAGKGARQRLRVVTPGNPNKP